MTGWEKVIAATLVAVVGLVALNLAIWRRMRAAGGTRTAANPLAGSENADSRDRA